MNTLKITDVIISSNKITVSYDVNGDWRKYIANGKDFWIEYKSDVSTIPKSIAVVPLIGSFITLAWLLDGEIIVDELDEAFYNCLPNVKEGFKKMYPNVKFGGKLTVGKVVKNNNAGSKSAALFSGGVDAYCTLLTHIDEKPNLVTIWGADVACDNEEGWKPVQQMTKNVASQFDLGDEIIHSNFRCVILDCELNDYLIKRTGDGWWHGFHHGIGLLSLVAPYTYLQGVSKLYIASSLTKEYWGKYTCSSDPVTDNETRFCGCQVIHDGYEYSRSDKIRIICNYSEKNNIPIKLRVCWESTDGKNCSSCEKCYRTMLSIFANKYNPIDFDFEYHNGNLLKSIEELKYINIKTRRYFDIQKTLRNNYTYFETPKSLRWFYRARLKNKAYYQHKKYRNINEFKNGVYYKMPVCLQELYNALKGRK